VAVYTRAQLWLLLGIAVLAGLGIAVGNWRRAHVELAERIEQFDTGATTGRPAPDSSVGLTEGPGGVAAARTGERQHSDHGAPPAEPAAVRRGRLAASRSPGALSQDPQEPPRHPEPVGLPPHQPAGGRLDLNRATIDELVRLPGVGPALAERILSARAEGGRFDSVDDLGRVWGVGPVKLARLRDLVTISARNASR